MAKRKKFDLHGKTIEVLRGKPDERFTAREIASEIFKNYPNECGEKQKRSAAINDDVISQIAAEIGSSRKNLQRKSPQLKVTDGRPKKYYYTESSEDEGTEQTRLLHHQQKVSKKMRCTRF